jgi:transmembrane sensor
MSKLTQFPDMERVREEAALWIARLDRGLSAEEQLQLREWMKLPAHRRAMHDLSDLWRELDVMSVLGEVLPLPDNPKQLLNTSRMFRLAAIASVAFIALSLAAVVAWYGPFNQRAAQVAATPAVLVEAFATAVGEQRTITLRDGSMLSLNTNSLVEVAMGQGARTLRLQRGEAHFEVTHDASRPFRVSIGQRTVEAVGTAFNIRRHDSGTLDVLVSDGRVRVSLAPAESTVSEGQLLTVSADDKSTLAQISPSDMDSRLAWRRGVLVFKGETLEQALAEVSRYSTRPIYVADASLGKLRIGGYFPTTDQQPFLAALRANFGIEAVESASGLTLKAARSPPN